MRVVAANKVLLTKGETLSLHGVVLDSEHRVVGFSPLVDATVERPFVEFFCGLITPAIPSYNPSQTSLRPLNEYPFEPLAVGYQGELWLWTDLNLQTLIPTTQTSYRVL